MVAFEKNSSSSSTSSFGAGAKSLSPLGNPLLEWQRHRV
jgi:hypothetical protein